MKRRSDRGYALLLAVFVLFLVGFSASLLVLSLQLDLGEQRREIVRLRLDLLNDAVTAETLGRLAIDRSFAGVSQLELGEGSATSRVEHVGSDEEAIELMIRTVAKLGSARRRSTTRVLLGDGDMRLDFGTSR